MMEKTQKLRSFDDPKDAELFRSECEIKGMSLVVEPRDTYDGDEDQLARLGKKQVLKVCYQCPKLI